MKFPPDRISLRRPAGFFGAGPNVLLPPGHRASKIRLANDDGIEIVAWVTRWSTLFFYCPSLEPVDR
ncbi:MAG TPA: hypothetical protein VNO55_27515, partial [Polyangia bacterium]|nr:hypothetical protein [Polyangia bacterium]